MKPDGRIRRTNEVHCGKCGAFVGGLGNQAAIELRLHYGWSKIPKLGWCCQSCATAIRKGQPN